MKILICAGTSGIASGAKEVIAAFEKKLAEHNLTDQYEIVATGDRGLFRDVLVDIVADDERTVYEFVTEDDVEGIVTDHLVNGEKYTKKLAGESYNDFFKDQVRIVLRNCGEINPESIDEYIASGGYEALQKLKSMTPEEVLNEVKESGIRGRGGAGFPTGTKWGFCANTQSDTKYVVCNADEGDPGAFMDRAVLEGDPHAVIEGMTIAAYAIGGNKGIIYCRAEYPLAIERLELAIKQAKDRGFLGDNILPGFSFDLKIKQGAGAFVCGEETALIASIEGERGTPRARPPFPAVSGVFGKPTLINNVETLANIAQIVVRGAKWYASMGVEGSTGTKVFALAGKVKNTGLVEVPMGTTMRDLVYGPGGGMVEKRIPFKGIQMGGPSGGCLPESLLDTPIDYESINKTGAIMGSGGVIIMDQRSCMVDIARFFLEFTVAESCGKCTPCRVGLKRMLDVFERITKGEGKPRDIDFLKEMGNTIKNTAHCGLGNTAPNPVLTTLRYFMDEYTAHIEAKSCPSHVCTELIDFVVVESACVKCGACKRVCPVDAITWEKGQVAAIDLEKCTHCKSCIAACKFMAIR